MEPPLIDSSIEHIEFTIEGARDGFLANKWMCHFFGKVLFGMTLWRTNHLGWELKGFKSPDLDTCLNAFVESIEHELKYFKILIPRIKDRMSNEGITELPEKSDL